MIGVAISFGSDTACCVVGVVNPGGATVALEGAVGSGLPGVVGLTVVVELGRVGLVGVVVGAAGALGAGGAGCAGASTAACKINPSNRTTRMFFMEIFKGKFVG